MTASIRLAVDVARSRIDPPHYRLIFMERRGVAHWLGKLKIYDPEPVEPAEWWEPIELDLDEWPYEPPRKHRENTWLPVVGV